MKTYKLWCLEPGMRKCIVSKDVVFNEAMMGNLVSKDEKGNTNNQSTSSSRSSRVQFEVEPQEISQKEAELDPSSSDYFDQETIDQQFDLTSYNLIRDKEKRSVRAPSRYDYADIIAFTFSVAESINEDEPMTCYEAITNKDKDKWLSAMKEEIQSLYKNNT